MASSISPLPLVVGALPATLLPVTGRVLMSALFLVSGVGKIAAPAATLATIRAADLEQGGGGLLLIAGYRARIVALVLAAFAVATALTFHSALADQNQMFHFLKNLAVAGGLLQVAAFGAGPLSLDARQGRV